MARQTALDDGETLFLDEFLERVKELIRQGDSATRRKVVRASIELQRILTHE
jgi:hypothetical protein